MRFVGDLDYKEGRSPGQTTAVVLQRCLQALGKDTAEFLEALSIQPGAFFVSINTDWARRPFVGRHVFRVLQAAGYEGTEHDIWYSVTGCTAPYRVTMQPPQAPPKKRKTPIAVKKRSR